VKGEQDRGSEGKVGQGTGHLPVANIDSSCISGTLRK